MNQKGRKTTTWPLSMKVVRASGSVAAGVNMLEPALHFASPGAQQEGEEIFVKQEGWKTVK